MTAVGSAWPTVIIGGAPRAGTSSLFDLLLGTGAFGRRSRKELFLLNDADFWIQGATPSWLEVGDVCYERAGFRHEDRFIDASSTYLYQETAPAACAHRLAAHPGSPLLVVFCLREPADRLYSNFRYFRDVLQRIPADVTFPAYADALLGSGWSSGNQQVDLALAHGDYPAWLRRWESAVGRRRLLLVRTEAIARDPQRIVADIGRHIGAVLELGSGGRSNAAYRPRFPLLHSLARRIGSVLPHGALRERLKSAYVSAAAGPDEGFASPDDQEALERVRGYYRARRAEFAAAGLGWYAQT
jgi:hypothetical protein